MPFELLDANDIKGRKSLKDGTLDLIDSINSVLDIYDRMTIRQIYYQLATRYIVELTKTGYQQVQYAVKNGRKKGKIDWSRVVEMALYDIFSDILSEYGV